MLQVLVKKDWDGYLAQVKWHENLFAFGYTKQEAKNELLNVVEMMLDYNLELVEQQRTLKNKLLLERTAHYAL